MVTITLEIPDRLASDIEPIRGELPLFLSITRQLFRPASDETAHAQPIYFAYKQLIDFLALSPSPEQIKNFAISPRAQERVDDLLDKHGEDELTDEEAAELRVYRQINEVMGMKKAEAALALAGTI
ncbi:hypothetical protein KFU94_59185 [Chloroflexi bacterium TSY]|nr:hypothetical protein [Chloroflexi bacterium TSY]